MKSLRDFSPGTIGRGAAKTVTATEDAAKAARAAGREATAAYRAERNTGPRRAPPGGPPEPPKYGDWRDNVRPPPEPPKSGQGKLKTAAQIGTGAAAATAAYAMTPDNMNLINPPVPGSWSEWIHNKLGGARKEPLTMTQAANTVIPGLVPTVEGTRNPTAVQGNADIAQEEPQGNAPQGNAPPGYMSAEDVVKGPYVKLAEGEGAMKFGNRPAVGLRTNPGEAQPNTRHTDISGLKDLARTGPVGAMAALSAYGSLQRMKSAHAGMNLRQQQIQVQLAQAAQTQANSDREYKRAGETEQRNIMNDDVEKDVIAAEPPQKVGGFGVGEKETDYNNRIRVATAKSRNDIKYGLAARGKSYEQLSSRDKSELFLSLAAKRNYESAQTKFGERFKNYAQTTNNSRNPYDYLPSGAEGTIMPSQGGYNIKLRGGNTIYVQNAIGGGFNWTGPNNPVDKQLTALVTPYIEAFEAKRKRNK